MRRKRVNESMQRESVGKNDSQNDSEILFHDGEMKRKSSKNNLITYNIRNESDREREKRKKEDLGQR